MSKKFAVYPGTFDPITNGHLDILKRGLRIFDEIKILLAKNLQKNTVFTFEERINQIKKVVKNESIQDKVSIESFEGLLIDYCKRNDIKVIIRGIRPLVDFEYEFEMAMANREMSRDVETIFILTDQEYFYLRSSLIKELTLLGGDISGKVPDCIKEEIIKKLS